MASLLEKRLARVIERHGEDTPYIQMLRDQIHAQETGKSAEDIYITGSVKRTKEPLPPRDEDK